jgi:hypothetical protein
VWQSVAERLVLVQRIKQARGSNRIKTQRNATNLDIEVGKMICERNWIPLSHDN